jgi:hypothetical protein
VAHRALARPLEISPLIRVQNVRTQAARVERDGSEQLLVDRMKRARYCKESSQGSGNASAIPCKRFDGLLRGMHAADVHVARGLEIERLSG